MTEHIEPNPLDHINKPTHDPDPGGFLASAGETSVGGRENAGEFNIEVIVGLVEEAETEIKRIDEELGREIRRLVGGEKGSDN